MTIRGQNEQTQDGLFVLNGGNLTDEEAAPLLGRHPKTPPSRKDEVWVKPRGFALIETAGFDGTVTASTYTVISSELQLSWLASWITTSYLLTSTASQPLYGRFSDAFGRRACVLFATALFGLGCLGCAISPTMICLIIMRAIAGLGGGGLMTMTTIINSDMVPDKHRGMYQALQNVLHGLGAICGATLGGTISDSVGWRTCFFAQAPFSLVAFILAYNIIPGKHTAPENTATRHCSSWRQIDVAGASLLFFGLMFQLTAMSLGSDLSWAHPSVIVMLTASSLLMVAFVAHERGEQATPILPLGMLVGRERVALLICNVSLGVVAYGLLFILPLFFQTVLLDAPSVAGLRLIAPSLATPLGGLTTGLAMRIGDSLTALTRTGLFFLLVTICMILTLGKHDQEWKYSTYGILGNFGQGMAYPSLLFGVVRATGKEGIRVEHAVATSLVYLTRALGSVWGVAAVSTIFQWSFSDKIQDALPDIPGAEEALDKLRRSTTALRDLDSELQSAAIN
ncbi:hypothetical protein CDV31_015655 [Fusarium ambrosium]|uniref:Major facilitator superfamily (MFS) profile domain-containing protein n=1 Tax=Fusarium ambrosium TaxID=131363 RepID=A0A428SL66_9HYPO|nr:hypothetical protein CDV31_015655 [Fusarium ambrosium]